MDNILVMQANAEHTVLAEFICSLYEESAKERGTGIAKRNPEYIKKKMQTGNSIIAFTKNGDFVGFCYIETWSHGEFVANSGLIVKHDYRKTGVAKRIKQKAFELSRKKFPEAKVFGLTTSLAVMKINSELGYRPTTFSELTTDDDFWKGCSTCVNYDVLTRSNRKHCVCTGMIYDPNKANKKKKREFNVLAKVFERLIQFKNFLFFTKKNNH